MIGQVNDWPSDLALGSVSRSPFGRFSLAGRAEGHGEGRNGSSGEPDEGTNDEIHCKGRWSHILIVALYSSNR